MKTALAAICALTLLAVTFLSLSLAILRPPRANYQQWMLVASVIVAQGALTLTALRSGNRLHRAFGGRGMRYLVAVGGVILAALGASSVYRTISGPHFEGFALVVGSALVVQGLLTVATFLLKPTSGGSRSPCGVRAGSDVPEPRLVQKSTP